MSSMIKMEGSWVNPELICSIKIDDAHPTDRDGLNCYIVVRTLDGYKHVWKSGFNTTKEAEEWLENLNKSPE